MAVVTVQLAVSTLQINFMEMPLWTALLEMDWIAALIAAIAAIVALIWRINAAWLVFGGAIAGWLVHLLL